MVATSYLAVGCFSGPTTCPLRHDAGSRAVWILELPVTRGLKDRGLGPRLVQTSNFKWTEVQLLESWKGYL